jgi:hypothetical protein
MYVRGKKANSGNLASNVVKGSFRSNDLADVGVNIGISLATNVAGNQIQKNTTVSKFNSTVTASTSSAGGKIPTSGGSSRVGSIIPVTERNKKNISTSSWGETSGLYPVKISKDKLGKNVSLKKSDLFNPNKWDPELLQQLLKARAAINLVATRTSALHNAKPNLNDPIEKLLAAYHLTDNFPSVDLEIKNDSEVKFFYLSSDKNIKTPSISSKYWDQKTVKTYGPFYSIGGGDAGTGEIYLIFYKAVKKP